MEEGIEKTAPPQDSAEVQIAKAAARAFAGKNWHKLDSQETVLVTKLERGKYIIPNNPPNGFVGSLNPVLL